MSDDKHSDFEQKVKASLNANVENLDANTREQLTTARRKALNQSAKKTWLNSWQQFWLPAGSLALCSLLAIFILVNPTPKDSTSHIVNNQTESQMQEESSDQVVALELLNDTDDGDETSDPDFYLWADEVLASESVPHAV